MKEFQIQCEVGPEIATTSIMKPLLLRDAHVAKCDGCEEHKIVRVTLVGNPLGGEFRDKRSGLRLCAQCHLHGHKETEWKEYQIQCEGGPEIAISRWPDGKYSIKVFSASGNQVAHLILAHPEGEKMTDAMNNLRHEFDLQVA